MLRLPSAVLINMPETPTAIPNAFEFLTINSSKWRLVSGG
jgi:hypothetical protein